MRADAMKEPRGGPPCIIVGGRECGGMLAVMRSLGRRGIPVHVLAPAEALPVYAASRFCRGARPLPGGDDVRSFRAVLLEVLERIRSAAPPLVLPMNDAACELADRCRPELEARCRLMLADSVPLRKMLHKEQAHVAARACGLTVPETLAVSCEADLRRAAGTFPMPVILKPNSWEERGALPDFKTERCARPEDVLERGRYLLARGVRLIAQQYVAGGDGAVEVYMFYRSRDGRVLHGCTGRKIRQHPPGAGVMAAGETVPLPDIEALSRLLLLGLDYRGLGGIEYKRLGGACYFIEMSVRLEAFHALAARAGIDLAWLAYADWAYGACPAAVTQKPAYWLAGAAYLRQLLRPATSAAVLREWVRIVLSGRCQFAVASLRDPLPSLRHAAYLIRRKARRGAGVSGGR